MGRLDNGWDEDGIGCLIQLRRMMEPQCLKRVGAIYMGHLIVYVIGNPDKMHGRLGHHDETTGVCLSGQWTVIDQEESCHYPETQRDIDGEFKKLDLAKSLSHAF